jgi:hypothetical protein
MMQPQLSLSDYFGGKSIVLRSDPIDFFKSYSQHLTQLGGKWNPNLKAPAGVGVLGGWIFPKSKEAQVRNGVAQITSGQVQPQASYSSSQGQTDTLQQAIYGTPQNSSANSMQQIIARAQAQNIAPQQAPMTVNSMQHILSRAQSNIMANEPSIEIIPLAETPSINNIPSIPYGYQQIVYIVIKPQVGQTLQLHIAGQKISVSVEKVEINNNITNEAIIRLPDNQVTKIILTNDQWSIPGYDQSHSITLL